MGLCSLVPKQKRGVCTEGREAGSTQEGFGQSLRAPPPNTSCHDRTGCRVWRARCPLLQVLHLDLDLRLVTTSRAYAGCLEENCGLSHAGCLGGDCGLSHAGCLGGDHSLGGAITEQLAPPENWVR